MSSKSKTFCQSFLVEFITVVPYHAINNGQAERFIENSFELIHRYVAFSAYPKVDAFYHSKHFLTPETVLHLQINYQTIYGALLFGLVISVLFEGS